MNVTRSFVLYLVLYPGLLVYVAWPLSLLQRGCGVGIALFGLVAFPILCLIPSVRDRLWTRIRLLAAICLPAVGVAVFKTYTFWRSAWN